MTLARFIHMSCWMYLVEHEKQLEQIQEELKNEQAKKIKDLEGIISHRCIC